MNGMMRGHLALRQRASPSALPLIPHTTACLYGMNGYVTVL